MTYWGGAGAGSVAAAGGEWRGTQRREQRPARPERPERETHSVPTKDRWLKSKSVSRGRTKGKCGEGAQKQPGAAFCISVDSRFDDNRAGTLAAIAERVYEPSLHSSCRALRRM